MVLKPQANQFSLGIQPKFIQVCMINSRHTLLPNNIGSNNNDGSPSTFTVHRRLFFIFRIWTGIFKQHQHGFSPRKIKILWKNA